MGMEEMQLLINWQGGVIKSRIGFELRTDGFPGGLIMKWLVTASKKRIKIPVGLAPRP